MNNKNQNGFTRFGVTVVILIICSIGIGIFLFMQGNIGPDSESEIGSPGNEVANMLSVDETKLPTGWQVTPKDTPVSATNYKSLGYRHELHLTNLNSTSSRQTDDAAYCFISIYQIAKDGTRGRSAKNLLASDIANAEKSAKSTEKEQLTEFTSEPVLAVTTARGEQQLPANEYVVSFVNAFSKLKFTKYNSIAYLDAGNYLAKVGYTCNSDSAAKLASETIRSAVLFN